jgi:Ca2+-binding RTX toxin-like protein
MPPPRLIPLALATTVLVGSLAALAPPAGAAPLCTFNSTTKSAAITAPAGTGLLTLKAAAGFVDVQDVSCAPLTAVDIVSVDVTAAPEMTVKFDLAAGPLGPGFTNELGTSDEIEFVVLGLGLQGRVLVVGTPDSANDVRVGQFKTVQDPQLRASVNLNAAVDLAAGGTLDADVTVRGFLGRVELIGGTGADNFSGTGSAVVTSPYSGPLRFQPFTGPDTFTGGPGPDEVALSMGDPADSLDAGAGTDLLRIFGPQFASASYSLDGVANDGVNCPAACEGDNIGTSFETVIGDVSSERIVGDGDAETLVSGGGNDTLIGGGGADLLEGNTLTGVVMQGGAGPDVLVNRGEADSLSGGPDSDRVQFDGATAGVAVSLDGLPNDGVPGQQASVGADVEVVRGTNLADTFTGNDRANRFVGAGGNDIFTLRGGDDTAEPGPGVDTISGGAGRDQVSYLQSLTAVTIRAALRTTTGEGTDTYAGVEWFIGSAQADTFRGSGAGQRFDGFSGNDTATAAGGNDVLNGQLGNDRLDGGAGTDTCRQGPGTGLVTRCER